MPSFDIVSEIDQHELDNALDQANREISTRFDFKGVKASFAKTDEKLTLISENEFQLKQMQEILKLKCVKRNIDIQCLDIKDPSSNLKEAKQEIIVKQGIDKDVGKKIVKIIKDAQLKVQAAIQDKQIRVTGKKRDDLQEVIALLRKQTTLGIPLQFTNFRD